ncbi:MAG TPA: ester cyclase [Thermoleophilaceae bacterium]|nr:ester cyclase [Thermoleophilaceae bacterium]
MAVRNPPPPVDFDAARIDKGPLTPLQLKREAIVREHMDSENRHEVEPAIATFAEHPRYELYSMHEVFDGHEAVNLYFTDLWKTFPDLRAELINLRHAEDAVIIEVDLAATWLGPFRGLPPTGRSYRCRQAVFFLFEDDRLVIERVYFDAITVLRQLGLADDPTKLRGQLTAVLTHPGTVVRGLKRMISTRKRSGG